MNIMEMYEQFYSPQQRDPQQSMEMPTYDYMNSVPGLNQNNPAMDQEVIDNANARTIPDDWRKINGVSDVSGFANAGMEAPPLPVDDPMAKLKMLMSMQPQTQRQSMPMQGNIMNYIASLGGAR